MDCKKVIRLMNWLIDNIFVTFGDKVFRQQIGIPMVLIVLLSWPICFYIRMNSNGLTNKGYKKIPSSYINSNVAADISTIFV